MSRDGAKAWLNVGRGAPSGAKKPGPAKGGASSGDRKGGGRGREGNGRDDGKNRNRMEDERAMGKRSRGEDREREDWDAEEEEEEEYQHQEEEEYETQRPGRYQRPQGRNQGGYGNQTYGNPQGGGGGRRRQEQPKHENKNLQSQINDLKREQVAVSTIVRDLDSWANTAVFFGLPSDWGDPLEERSDSWKFAVKNGTAGDLISPTVHLGSCLVGTIMSSWNEKMAEKYNEHADIDADQVQKWMDFHEDLMKKEGAGSLESSLQLIVVKRKPPRRENGKEIGGDRLLLKVRPTLDKFTLWKPILALIKEEAKEQGGYSAGPMPPSANIRKWRGRR